MQRRLLVSGFCLALIMLLNVSLISVRAKEFSGASSPTWSPDGQQIAFSYHNGEKGILYVVGKQDTKPLKLADNGDAPSWSPDGKRLAYAEFVGESSTIYTINADGSERTKVAAGSLPAWSPDARQISYVNDDKLYIVNADGSAPRMLLQDQKMDVWSYRWSPDGSRIAAAMGRPSANWATVFTVKPDGSAVQKVADWVGSLISWSPDSKYLAYSGECGAQREAGLCITDTASLETRTLIKRAIQSPVWSPDGKHIAVALAQGITIIDADGSNQRLLTGTQREDYLLPSAWSPDSQQILVNRTHDVKSNSAQTMPFVVEVLVFQADGSSYYRLAEGIGSM